MKRKHVLLFTTLFVLTLCAACNCWLHIQKWQHNLNRRLIDALVYNDPKTALALVEAGADPNTRQELPPASAPLQYLLHWLRPSPLFVDKSPTAFMLACTMHSYSSRDIAEPEKELPEDITLLHVMAAHGANLQAKDGQKRTALMYAATSDRLRTADFLIQHGVNVNTQDRFSLTPLHWAAMHNDGAMLHLFLTHGANANASQKQLGTPLLYAVLYHDAHNLIADLLAHGADANIPNSAGLTPLRAAKMACSRELVRLLERAAGR